MATAPTYITSVVNPIGANISHFDPNEICKLSVLNLTKVTEKLFSSGQPTSGELEALHHYGIECVINLIPETSEQWKKEEAVKLKRLGVVLHKLPIVGKEGVTFENALALRKLLDDAKDQPTLLHCATGNRNGALKALIEFLENGQDSERAIIEGKRWGLTKLENHVREVLDTEKQQQAFSSQYKLN
ncbi:MAG: fused DSP-PTPase phosphatase/NAD kinase-like protein [Parashewanella sp.]